MYPIAATLRPRWTALPMVVRSQVEALLDGEVVTATSADGGFGNGFAGALTMRDGRQVFVKLAAESVNEFATNALRTEIFVTGQMPPIAPVPALLTSFEAELAVDDGSDTWVGMASEFVPGRSPDPARADHLELMVDLTLELSRFDPCPIQGLRRRVEDRHIFDRWVDTDGDAAGLGCYGASLTDHLDRIRSAAAEWALAVDGTALLHGDLRPDNIVTTDGRAYAVDWPAACVGAAWVDTLLMVPALMLMRGAPDPVAFLAAHPLLAPVDPAAIDAVLAAALGYFVTSSLQPPPPGLPTVRAFQRAQAESVLAWLLRRWDLD